MARSDPDAADANLVNRSLAGDRVAFGILVERHWADVARVLYAMFANLAEVEDLVQESFLRSYLDLERLRDPGRFGAWVRAIAVNLARMELRAGRQSLVSWESIRPSSNTSQPSPERLAERRELARRIRKAIASLPPAEREAIAHVYLNELSHEEAAEQLNTSVGAIKVRAHRGRRRLRTRLVVEFPAREGQVEAKMIEVTVQDVLTKLAEEATLPQVDESMPPVEQAEEWIVRFSTGSHRVILLAEKEGRHLLPIWVGPVEGEGIVIQLQGRSPLRPLTFDLMKELLAAGNMRLRSVAINRLHEKVYYGVLIVETDGAAREIDCRPSDAINLALRMEAPIYVAREVMAEQSVTAEGYGGYHYLPCEAGEQWVSLLQR